MGAGTPGGAPADSCATIRSVMTEVAPVAAGQQGHVRLSDEGVELLRALKYEMDAPDGAVSVEALRA